MATTLWPTNGTFSGRQLRQALGAFWGGLTGRPLGARSGVVVGTPTNTVTASSSTWTVKPHCGVLDVEANAIAGPYNYSTDTNVTGTMNVADQTNDRIDLISVTMADLSEGDTATSGPTFVYTPGTPASPALAPATPAKSLALATIRVPQSGTGSPSVTWIAPWAVAAGGILPVSGAAQYPSAPYVGQYIDDATLGLLRWDGANWDHGNIDTGWVTTGVNGLGANVASSVVLRRQGSLVQFSVAVTLSAFYANALSSGPTGNITNVAIATITDARFIPARQADTLNAGSVGSLLAGSIDATGQVIVNATVPNVTLAANAVVTLTGSYFAD
jgi:hypothetical protein